jgi:hypothetical protein
MDRVNPPFSVRLRDWNEIVIYEINMHIDFKFNVPTPSQQKEQDALARLVRAISWD